MLGVLDSFGLGPIEIVVIVTLGILLFGKTARYIGKGRSTSGLTKISRIRQARQP